MFRRASCFFAPAVTAADAQAAYRAMGLLPTASNDAVRSRYLQLARENHPDINGGDESKMKLVNTAYETVQVCGHLAKQAPSAKGGEAATNAAGREPNQYKAAAQRRGKSNAADHTAWNTKSEFDWAAAVYSVSDNERRNPAIHPRTHNKYFSFADDTALYEAVRGGASVSQAARTMGKTPLAIENRLNSGQFKMRIQSMLTKQRQAKGAYRKAVNPREQMVFRDPKAGGSAAGGSVQPEGGLGSVFDDEDNRGGGARMKQFSARQVVSPMGKSYAHFSRHTRQHKSR
jgi:hypothetical protein